MPRPRALLAASLFSLALAVPNATFIRSFNATNAAFLSLFSFPGAATPYSLVISQFTGNPFAPDLLGEIVDASTTLKPAVNVSVRTLSSAITWPNDHTLVAPGTMGTSQGLLVAGGFLVPPKTVGGIWAVPAAANWSFGSPLKLSVDRGSAYLDGWFYHRAVQKDVDGDGFVDIVTARATKPLFGTPAGELSWLRQPSSGNPLAQLPWQEGTLYNASMSPDVFFALANLRGDGDEQLIYTSFFTGGGLGLMLCPGCAPAGAPASASATTAAGPNTWSNVSSLVQVAIDTSIGPGFDVQVVDLNGDGALDLLVTNHVDSASSNFTSGVFAYEAPASGPLTSPGAWAKHVLASGFVVREPGLPGTQAAPGAARATPACTASGYSKPLITLSGDGDQRFYLLVPSSQDPTDWSYTLTEVYDCAGTAGRQAAADLDGDGCPEILLPCYDSGTVAVMRVTP